MEDTEFFLPSEIARLVYGHFKAKESEDLSTKFLNESPHLSECRELKKLNRTFKTEANGLPLKEILDQYLNMNKLRTVNKLVGDQQKFTDPVEAFSYLLSDNSKEKQLCTYVDTENPDSPESAANSDNDNEEIFSDFSLNFKTPEKLPSPEKVTKNKSETVIELNKTLDRSVQETTPETNKPPQTPASEIVIRQSTRLQLKNSLKNDRSCNSDSVKELRLNPNEDCKTPRKLGNPPYSENKLLKPKTPIPLLSSDSEPETLLDNELSVVNTPSDSCAVTERLMNGLFSPEKPKSSVKKKTLKVIRPRRPPPAKFGSDEQSSDNEKITCKRNRKTAMNNSSTSDNENKKSKLSDGITKVHKRTVDKEKTKRSSDEFVFTTDGLQNDEKQKTRRKSGSMVPANKSLPIIDDAIFGEKLMKNPKLQEHIAASINEVIINSPQKKANESDPLEELIKNSMDKIYNEEFESIMLDDFFKDLTYGEPSSNANSAPQFTGNEINATSAITDPPQINDQVTVEIEDPVANTIKNVESHPEKQNPAIIIEIREEQVVNQQSYMESTTTTAVSEEFRHYFSNTTGLEATPDGKLNSMKSDHASVINIMTSDGEISESCKITDDTTERIVLNSGPVLYSLNDNVPMIISKGSEFQICGAPSTITKLNHEKNQFVKIAPKPEFQSVPLADITTDRKVVKRRRTRGGKRT